MFNGLYANTTVHSYIQPKRCYRSLECEALMNAKCCAPAPRTVVCEYTYVADDDATNAISIKKLKNGDNHNVDCAITCTT